MPGIADLALRRPWALLGGNLVAAGIAIAVALGAPSDLGVGSTRLDDPRPERLTVVLERDGAVGWGVLSVARDVVAAQLEADPAVAAVRIVDRERRSVLRARLEETSAAAREQAVERIERGIDPGLVRAMVGGETAALIEARRVLGDDLWRLQLVVLPLVLLLAIAATGLRAAIAPNICVVTAVAGSLALLRLSGVALDASLLGAAPALAVGVVLGIEMPALVVRLHRDEAALARGPAALRQGVARAGPLLFGAAGAASLPAMALIATPLEQAASLALGCAFAALLAAASAITATPAAIAILAGAGGADPAAPGGEDHGPGRLSRWARSFPGFIAGGPVRCGLLALVALSVGLALAYPALDGVSRPFVAADLPAASNVVRATLPGGAQGAGPGDSLFGELPLVAGLAAAVLAIVLVVATRAPGAVVAVPFAFLPAAAGLGVCVYVLDQGHLATTLGSEGRGTLDTAAVAAGAAAVAAIGAGRAVIALQATRAERRLGVDPRGAAERAARLTLPGGEAAALAGAAVCAALIGSDLAAVRELGLIVSAGLLVDLLLVRIPLLAALARWGPGAGPRG